MLLNQEFGISSATNGKLIRGKSVYSAENLMLHGIIRIKKLCTPRVLAFFKFVFIKEFVTFKLFPHSISCKMSINVIITTHAKICSFCMLKIHLLNKEIYALKISRVLLVTVQLIGPSSLLIKK